MRMTAWFLAAVTSLASVPALAQDVGEQRERTDARECHASSTAPDRTVDVSRYIACKRAREGRAVWGEAVAASPGSADRERRDFVECEFLSRLTSADRRIDDDAIEGCLVYRTNGDRAKVNAIRTRASNERDAERQRVAAGDAEQREQASAEARQQERRQRCGADYMRIAVGMSWSRVSDCAGPFREVGGLAVATGAVVQYRNTRAMVHVSNGVVVQWLAMR